MSRIPIDRSADLVRLREAGFKITISDAGFLLVKDVPYINSRREIAYGILAMDLDLAGDITTQPKDHTAKFVGEYPCNQSGAPLEILRHQSMEVSVGNKLVTQHSFSRKPTRGYYENYYEKVNHYASLICAPVALIDPNVTVRSGAVVEPDDDTSPHHYLDTASARAEINEITAKLAEESVAIIGLGGTGSYVLDLIAKTPIKNIHLFDGDCFLTHNAFRAPGAPTIEELRTQPNKVDYFKTIYSHMHRGIAAHPYYVDASNTGELQNMSFVFLCMDSGDAKTAIMDKLDAHQIPFVDVGMGLYKSRNKKIHGMLRTVLSVPDGKINARARISRVADDAENEYDKNIQVSDLNAINACYAVIAWKKLRGFYVDQGKERFSSYAVHATRLVKNDIP